jgi:uncharacterized protein YkwD
MCTRQLALAGILAWGLFLTTAPGQIVEAEATGAVQNSTDRQAKEGQGPELAEVAQQIMQHTNAFRQAESRPQVVVNAQLVRAARDFANFMARTDKYGHTADGKRPAERAKQHNYPACIVSENLATSYSPGGSTTEALARRLFQGWQHSPGHRKNLLDPDVTETGVAVARSKQTGHYYAVQMFGRPQSKRLEFRVVNRSPAVVTYEVGGQTLPLPPRATRAHQRCRPAALTFQWPNAQEPTTVQPHNGGRYTIRSEDSGRFKVARE